ncbi:MAG: hypothetical protein AAGD23_04580 [Pseudomonadota bacterium]
MDVYAAGRGTTELEPLASLRQLPHLGVLLGCYALLLNLAFAVVPLPAWLTPSDAVETEAGGGWSFDPLASLCHYASPGSPNDSDTPAGTSLACSKCCAPGAALAASGTSPITIPWVRASDHLALVTDPSIELRRAAMDLIRAPPVHA